MTAPWDAEAAALETLRIGDAIVICRGDDTTMRAAIAFLAERFQIAFDAGRATAPSGAEGMRPPTSSEISARFEADLAAFANGLRTDAPVYGLPRWLENSDYRDEIMKRAARLAADICAMVWLGDRAARALTAATNAVASRRTR
jgi:hypothetical protein